MYTDTWDTFHASHFTSTVQGTQSDTTVKGVSEFPDVPRRDDCPCVACSSALHGHPGYRAASF
jgi:hypothetical protein